MANQCLDLVRTAALAVVTHFLILFNLVADANRKTLDSEMAQLLFAIAHTVTRTVVAPLSIFAELVVAAQNKLLDAILASSHYAAAGCNKMLDAIVIFANLVTTAYGNIPPTDITEACLDILRVVARTIVARYLIIADFVAVAYHKILDSSLTHQCLTFANTMSRAVTDSFLAFTNSVTATYNQTFNADMAHKLSVITGTVAREVTRTVAGPFISFANTIASVCAAIRWWFEAAIYISCGLFVVILLYCAYTELRRFFVGNTRRPCQPADDITGPDVEMEDAPPIQSEMKDAPSVQSTSPPIACDGPELKGHFYQHPWRIRTPFGWELITKQNRRSTPQVLMQCPWEDRLMWGPDPAWVTSHNSRLLREDAARKQANQKRFEQRKYDIEYAKWAYRCHMSVADKPIYSTSAQPPKADFDSDKHGEPASKPQPDIVKSKPTRVVEERLLASTSTREPIPEAAPTPPAPTRRYRQTQASVSDPPEPVSSTAPINSAAPVHVEPISKRQPITVKSKVIGVSKHCLPAQEPNWTATPPPPAPPRRPDQKHVSLVAQPEPISSTAPIDSAAPAHVEPLNEPEEDIIESKTAGVPKQPLPLSAAIPSPISSAAPAARARPRRRSKKHVSVSVHTEPLSPTAPVTSAASTQVEPINEPEQDIVESKAVGASEQSPPPPASVLAPIPAAEPASPAPTEIRRKKHVTFAEAEPEPIPAPDSVLSAAPAPSATTFHAELSHEDKQAGSVPTPDAEAREAQAPVSNEPQPSASHRKRRSGLKPVERGNIVKTASGNVARRCKKPSAPPSATLKKWLVDRENTETSQSFAPPSQPMEDASKAAASLQPQDRHDGEGTLPAHFSLTNTPSEDMTMADVAEMPVAEPASEGETGMQGVEQAVAATDAPLPQELAMLDDVPHQVADRAPDVREQIMEDVVESPQMALDTMPLLSQTSLQAPAQALPAPNFLREFAEMAAAASAETVLELFTNAVVQPATPQQTIPQSIAPQPASHSEASQQAIESRPTPLDVQKDGRDIHMKLFRWAERADLEEADLKELFEDLEQIIKTCQDLRNLGIDGPIDKETPSMTQNYCEYIAATLDNTNPSDMCDEARRSCTYLQNGDFFGDGSQDSSLEEVIKLLCRIAHRLNEVLRVHMRQTPPLPLPVTNPGSPETNEYLIGLKEDLEVFKSYYNLWLPSFKRHVHGLDDTAQVFWALISLQLPVKHSHFTFPRFTKDKEREWFLDGLQVCQEVLEGYSPLREVTHLTQGQVIQKMEVWLVDSESRLRTAITGLSIRERQSALCLFARRLENFDEYCFNENGSPRRNVNAPRILSKLQVIKDIIVRMTPAQDDRNYQPIAREVLTLLQTRYSPTVVSNDGSEDVSQDTDFDDESDADDGDLGTGKKIRLTSSTSDSQSRTAPTAKTNPLQDGTVTVDKATKLIKLWLETSEGMLTNMLTKHNDSDFKGVHDLLLQHLKHIKEFLLAENRFWKPSAIGLPSSWRYEILEKLISIRGLCVRVKDTFQRHTWECYNAVDEICRPAPGIGIFWAPDDLKNLYDLVAPACEKYAKAILEIEKNVKTYSIETYWNMLMAQDGKEPFFARSREILDRVYTLAIKQNSDWWQQHVLANGFNHDTEKFREIRKKLADLTAWLKVLKGKDDALVDRKCSWLYLVWYRVNKLHESVEAEFKRRDQGTQ
ncbi:hypothetical protein CBER1_07306 [Cercospora berteroae]|uniref:Uncharacterized protein n=1 Tax=Cercospora berteroae TaxID=357750 RepID=A0A2S6CEY7_9PEZI|nr:hypothetical protein CBER1_07306 [Cercospora berteroae]